MQRVEFEEAVATILARDTRYEAGGYLFLRDALDFTLKETADAGAKENRHVSGPELLEGFRKYALNEFGPMVTTVLDEWGIRSCADVGEMVFNLIEVGVFGKTANDRKEDFSDVYDFEEVFRRPFLPVRGTAKGPAAPGEERSGARKPEKSA